MTKKLKDNFSPAKKSQKLLITIKEASDLSGLSEHYIRKLVNHNKIRAFRNREARSKIFIVRADFLRLLGAVTGEDFGA